MVHSWLHEVSTYENLNADTQLMHFYRYEDQHNIEIERFSFECRKAIGFAFTTLRDWLKRFAPLFHPIRSKTKTHYVIASRTLRQLDVITSSFDWFTVLSMFFVIG